MKSGLLEFLRGFTDTLLMFKAAVVYTCSCEAAVVVYVGDVGE